MLPLPSQFIVAMVGHAINERMARRRSPFRRSHCRLDRAQVAGASVARLAALVGRLAIGSGLQRRAARAGQRGVGGTAVVGRSAKLRVARDGAGDARTRTALVHRFSGAAGSCGARRAFRDHDSARRELYAGQLGRLSCVEILCKT